MDGNHEKILLNYRGVRIKRFASTESDVYLDWRTWKPKNG